MRHITMMLLVVGSFALASVAPAQGLDLGETVFKQKCASCHGADGKGNAKMGAILKVTIADLTKIGDRTTAELTKLISAGKNPMPAFGKR